MNLNSIKQNPFILKFMNEKTIKFFILLAYFILFFFQHYHLTYVGDDLIMGPGVDTYTLKENFIWHWGYNGRIITDVFANMWYRIPMMYWKIFDTSLYVVAALLISRIFTPNTWKHLLLVCGLILLFPFKYMESAGYIATSANYFYPLVGILVVLLMVKYLLEGKKIPLPLYIISVICIIYITNHDQTAVGLLVGMFCFLIYCFVTKAEPHLTKHVLGIFLFTTVMYISFFLIVPGHQARMHSTAEMELWFPEYANWTFWDKVFHGYSSTVANAFFNDVRLVTLFAALLMMVSFRKKNPLQIIVGCIPFTGIMISHYMGIGQFIYHFDRSYGMPELIPTYIFSFPLILSIIILASVFLAVWFNVDKLENKLLIILLLILAAGTREMMGFTATIYASSFRTFTFFLYAILGCCLIILNEIEEEGHHPELWYMGAGAIIALLTI